jgi:hypothetical protein
MTCHLDMHACIRGRAGVHVLPHELARARMRAHGSRTGDLDAQYVCAQDTPRMMHGDEKRL